MLRTLRDKVKSFFAWLIMLNDTPHSIAMGAAAGIFISLTPTVGLHMVLIIVLSFFIRMNRTAGCATVWLNSPPLLFVTFFLNYLVGSWMLFQQPMGWHDFMSCFHGAWQAAFSNASWYENLWAMFVIFGTMACQIAWPLCLGSIVVGIVCAVPTYFFVRWLVVRYHKARHAAHLARVAEQNAGAKGEAPPPSAPV
jgi:uncharacterized protein (DUF2062 family)